MFDLSIVIAAGGRLEDLQSCLDGLVDQAHKGTGCEIILAVPDEGSAYFTQLFPLLHLRFIRIDNGDLGEAWTRGADAATGEVLLFMRDDFRASAGMVAGHRAMHDERSDVLAVGLIRPNSRRQGVEAGLADHWYEALRNPGSSKEVVSEIEFAGQTLSLRRDTFRGVGPFCGGLEWGTEVELAFKARKHGSILRRLGEPVGEGHRAASDSETTSTARLAGASAVKLYRRVPELLPQLELGEFQRGSRAGLWLRALLLAIGGPALPFGLIERLLPRGRPAARWNRFLLSYQYWRGVRQEITDQALWQSLTRAPVILMYHAVAHPGERAGRYIVPLRRFKREMAWLRLARYRVLSLEELLDCRREHRLPPGRSVVLTFDDGYSDNRRFAFPALQAQGFPATFFVVTRNIEDKNVWDDKGELAGRALLSWNDIREMLKAGMQIGAHTRHHVALPSVSSQEADREIAGSRVDLERELGRPVRTFAYPYGLLEQTTPDAVARAGFDGACCSRSGPNTAVVSSYLLRRLEVQGTDSLLRFIRALRWGYAPRRRPGG